MASLEGCVHQFCYFDDIGSSSTTELTINWNASLSWVSSFTADQEVGGRVGENDCPTARTTAAAPGATALRGPRAVRGHRAHPRTGDAARA